MASSKDKAIALKNNYVAGLIEAGATAPMPTMPEQMMGNIASTHLDVRSGRKLSINDGIPDAYYHDPVTRKSAVKEDSSAAYPAEGHSLFEVMRGVPGQANLDYSESFEYGDMSDEMGKRRARREREGAISIANQDDWRNTGGFTPTRYIDIDSVRKGRRLR